MSVECVDGCLHFIVAVTYFGGVVVVPAASAAGRRGCLYARVSVASLEL